MLRPHRVLEIFNPPVCIQQTSNEHPRRESNETQINHLYIHTSPLLLPLQVHRRLLVDDAFGAGEALNESGISGKGLVVRGGCQSVLGPTADCHVIAQINIL